MYRYFQAASPATEMPTDLVEGLKKRHIDNIIEPYSNEKDLAEKLATLAKSQFNTVVMIGGDADFETLVGLAKLLPAEVALGFLPTQPGRISGRMQLKNHHDAIETLAQRRITEITVFSVGSRFFFDEIELQLGDVTTDYPLSVTVDQKLFLRAPKAIARIENVSAEQFRIKSPLQLQLFTMDPDQKAGVPLFAELHKKITGSSKNHRTKISQVHGKQFGLEAASNFYDNFNRNYGSRLRVGQQTKALRLITKRGTQL